MTWVIINHVGDLIELSHEPPVQDFIRFVFCIEDGLIKTTKKITSHSIYLSLTTQFSLTTMESLQKATQFSSVALTLSETREIFL